MSASSGGSSENLPFHFVLFPTASLLSLEGFTVVAEVTRITTIERGVVDLLAGPFLSCRDRRPTVGTLMVNKAIDHFYPRELSRTKSSWQSLCQAVVTANSANCCNLMISAGLLKGVTVRRKCLGLRVQTQPKWHCSLHCEVGPICYRIVFADHRTTCRKVFKVFQGRAKTVLQDRHRARHSPNTLNQSLAGER
jgi:hypothetical protein